MQSSLTYPDTFVPRLTVRITEFPDKWVTFCRGMGIGSRTGVRINEAPLYNHNWFTNMCPDKWGQDKWVWISEASLYMYSEFSVFVSLITNFEMKQQCGIYTSNNVVIHVNFSWTFQTQIRKVSSKFTWIVHTKFRWSCEFSFIKYSIWQKNYRIIQRDLYIKQKF